jgi:predicted  nucleic acid-binding Zn-ribbon protein
MSITPNRNNSQNSAIRTNEAVHLDVEGTSSVSKAVNQETMLQEKENMIEGLKSKLEESQKSFKELKGEMVDIEQKVKQMNEY